MCKCCKVIKELQEIENERKENKEIKHILKARLTSITRKKGIKKEIGVINFDSYELNYCPECRKEVKRCVNIVKKENTSKKGQMIIFFLKYMESI